jgi:sulfhydrogenase subunit beta (sulfur reductase)
MAKILKKHNLHYFLEYLEGRYEFYGPSKHAKNECGFKKIKASDYCYSCCFTPEGPKKFIFPPLSKLLEKDLPKKNKVIIGVRAKDIKGIDLLDRAFEKPFYDHEYFNIRDQYIIVGVDECEPPGKGGFDLYLQVLENGDYLAYAGSSIGAKFLPLSFFDEYSGERIQNKLEIAEILKHPRLSEAVAKSFESKIWDDLAKRCTGCGICSYVCPACYCFDIKDSFDLKGCTKRERCWDSCILYPFAEIAEGYNFRGELRNRLYNWYYHKFVRMPKELGTIGCVGCSRCIIYCPAKINYLETLEELIIELERKSAKKSLSANKR